MRRVCRLFIAAGPTVFLTFGAQAATAHGAGEVPGPANIVHVEIRGGALGSQDGEKVNSVVVNGAPLVIKNQVDHSYTSTATETDSNAPTYSLGTYPTGDRATIAAVAGKPGHVTVKFIYENSRLIQKGYASVGGQTIDLPTLGEVSLDEAVDLTPAKTQTILLLDHGKALGQVSLTLD